MQEWVVAQDGGTGDIVPYFTLEIDGTVGFQMADCSICLQKC